MSWSYLRCIGFLSPSTGVFHPLWKFSAIIPSDAASSPLPLSKFLMGLWLLLYFRWHSTCPSLNSHACLSAGSSCRSIFPVNKSPYDMLCLPLLWKRMLELDLRHKLLTGALKLRKRQTKKQVWAEGKGKLRWRFNRILANPAGSSAVKFSVRVLPQDETGCLYPLIAQSLDTRTSGEAAEANSEGADSWRLCDDRTPGGRMSPSSRGISMTHLWVCHMWLAVSPALPLLLFYEAVFFFL